MGHPLPIPGGGEGMEGAIDEKIGLQRYAFQWDNVPYVWDGQEVFYPSPFPHPLPRFPYPIEGL